MHRQTFIANQGDSELQIDVTPQEQGRYVVQVGERVHQVDARRFAGGTWSLLIDGESYDVELEVAGKTESDGQYNALVRGEVIALTIQDERQIRMRATSRRFKAEGPQTLKCPMPGKVIKVLIEPGTEVEEGQSLVIVEAMKMENELRSPRTGRATRILVAAGEAVEAGAELVVIE